MRDTKQIFSFQEKSYSPPPESIGRKRSDVKLLYVRDTTKFYSILRFEDIAKIIPRDSLLLFNDSMIIPARFNVILERTKKNLLVHVGRLPDSYVVEIRVGKLEAREGDRLIFEDGSMLQLHSRMPSFSRYWIAYPDGRFDLEKLGFKFGSYINYGNFEYRPHDGVYSSEFAKVPGSVEYPSASRAFTQDILCALRDKNVEIRTLTLHCNLASLDADEFWTSEKLLPEYYNVPAETASVLNRKINSGGKVIAVGTSVVRALETIYDGHQYVPGNGWTDIFIKKSLRSPISGLVTGMHDPSTSHILLLEAFCSPELLVSAYQTAEEYGFRWHEFGDVALIVREPRNMMYPTITQSVR